MHREQREKSRQAAARRQRRADRLKGARNTQSQHTKEALAAGARDLYLENS